MSRKLVLLSSAAAVIGGAAMADVPRVAADIAPVHSLVARVMEGVGSPDLVIPPGASPHEYSLRPSEAEALQEADLVFWIGEDLTPWLESAVETLAEGAAVTTLLEVDGISLLDFRENALFEAHDHDHGDEDHGHEEHAEGEHDHDEHDHDEHAEGEHGDDDHAHDEEHAHDDEHDHDKEHADADEHDHDHEEHAEAEHEHDDHGHDDHAHGDHDPHAWLSPANAGIWLNAIAAELSAADPDNAGTYFANAAAGREELEALTVEINAALDPIRGGSFIVFHDAYQYFEEAHDFPASGAISIGDATDPSPARIAEIQARIRDEGVDCVLAEPQFNPGLVATVLDGTEASTSVIDPLGAELEPGPSLYPQLLRNMAASLVECL